MRLLSDGCLSPLDCLTSLISLKLERFSNFGSWPHQGMRRAWPSHQQQLGKTNRFVMGHQLAEVIAQVAEPAINQGTAGIIRSSSTKRIDVRVCDKLLRVASWLCDRRADSFLQPFASNHDHVRLPRPGQGTISPLPSQVRDLSP